MPVGLITDVCALLVGGLLGNVIGKKLSKELKSALNNIFGFCAIAIGIHLIVRMNSLSAVVLSVVFGTILGNLLRLEDRVNGSIQGIAAKALHSSPGDDGSFAALFSAVAVIFCCSGTGWYGVLNEGFTGDSSILVTKAILDFFTAIIFAAILGKLVSYLAAPQLGIYIILFSLSKLVVPFITDNMIADFSAVGGIIELITGMRISGIKKDVKIIDVIPAMILVFPISALWTQLFC